MKSKVQKTTPALMGETTYPLIGELHPYAHPFERAVVVHHIALFVLFNAPGSGMVIGIDPRVDGTSTTSRTVNWAGRFAIGVYSPDWHEDSFKKLPAAKTVTITNS